METMPKSLYSAHRRFSFFEELATFVLRKLLSRRRRQFARTHKQLATFSFDLIGMEINIGGVYSGNDLDALFQWLRQAHPSLFQGTALDIGANIGNHALYFSDHFAKVLAFEPNGRTYELLKFNAGMAPNIEAYNVGISDRASDAWMVFNKVNMGGARVVRAAEADATQVKLAPLDTLVREDEDVTLVKIDVEGHEREVLLGSEKVIRRHRPLIMFEQHVKEIENGTSPCIELLRSYGYTRFLTLEIHPKSFRYLPGPLGQLLVFLWRSVAGERRYIVEKSSFEKRFYPFIIAAPDEIASRP
jgi:FkbM family methyltransferase